MTVNVGVLGYGYWGPNLVRNLATLPDVRVSIVGDADGARLGELTGCCATTTDSRRVLEAVDVDAVVVATPAATHFALARAAMLAGKHVLVEKPLAMSGAECRELIDIAARTRRVLMVGHTFLYNAAVRRLRDYVQSGELGSPLYIYSQRLNQGRVRRDVNALWNFAPHDVSILLYLLDREPLEASARGFARLNAGVDDVVFVTLTFPDDVGAHIHLSWLDLLKVRRLVVVGSRKMIVYDDVSTDAKLTLYDRGEDWLPTVDSPRDFTTFAEFQAIHRRGDVTIPTIRFEEPLAVQCAHFVECVRSGARPVTDGTHGWQVVRALEAAQRSLDAGGAPEKIA